MRCIFPGPLEIRKGEIIKITSAIPNTEPLRVSIIENLSTGKIHRSRMEGVIMAQPPQILVESIIGKVVSSEIRGEHNTDFVIEAGEIEDHVFVRAGEIKKGQDALLDIFSNRVETYVKVCDPYVSVDTIKLISNVANSIDILILSQRIMDLPTIKNEVSNLFNNIIIKKGANLHDRFILTKGEGWIVGHSLKDFGTKYSQLSKMISSLDAETAFDENWNLSTTVLEHRV